MCTFTSTYIVVPIYRVFLEPTLYDGSGKQIVPILSLKLHSFSSFKAKSIMS